MDNNIPDLIFASLENWDEVWRRNQFICSKLANKFPRLKILFIAPPRDISHAIRMGKFTKFHGKAIEVVPEFPNIIIIRPLKLFPNSFRWGCFLNEIFARKHILGIAKKIGIRNPILWLNSHSAVHMVGKMGERLVIYDITDDWTQAGFSEREKRLILEQDRLLCKMADLVIVCSKALEQSHKALCKELLLLPNAVDVEHYKPVSEQPRSKSSRWPSPVFGYTGTIHTDRIDINILKALARAFSDGSVVLIGPNHLHRQQRLLLSEEKNIYFIGEIPYARIAYYMSDFDICIAPHLETSFTESLNPIKLWEYLASGKPIVSTNIAGFRDYSHLCHIASGPENFVSACKDALSESGELRLARIAEASKNSWNSRMDRLLEVLQTLM